MFYHNTKYKFALWEMSPQAIAGGIIAASAMPQGQLIRRDLRKHRYLQHRLFDPQVYLAGLDPNSAEPSVINLASWPWFCESGVPEYDSDKHGSLSKWKETHSKDLLRAWPGQAPLDPEEITKAVRAAVIHQVEFGCEGILLPTPLTNVVAQNYEPETLWLDSGLEACHELQVALPTYATVAISDNVLRGVDPTQNPLLHTITNQIAARDKLAGAYIVIEQAAEDSYVCGIRDTLLSLLVLVDDLVRGAARRVIVNYMGTFGAIATAAGCSVWSSGYYLSQRRFRLPDYDDKIARAFPRFYSLRLTGDIALDSDVQAIHRAGLATRLFDDTTASKNLAAGLAAGSYPGSVPEWQYKASNIAAAGAHYNEVCFKIGVYLSSLDPKKRMEVIHRWLRTSVGLADLLKQSGIRTPYYTDVSHQRVWLEAFERWKDHAGV